MSVDGQRHKYTVVTVSNGWTWRQVLSPTKDDEVRSNDHCIIDQTRNAAISKLSSIMLPRTPRFRRFFLSLAKFQLPHDTKEPRVQFGHLPAATLLWRPKSFSLRTRSGDQKTTHVIVAYVWQQHSASAAEKNKTKQNKTPLDWTDLPAIRRFNASTVQALSSDQWRSRNTTLLLWCTAHELRTDHAVTCTNHTTAIAHPSVAFNNNQLSTAVIQNRRRSGAIYNSLSKNFLIRLRRLWPSRHCPLGRRPARSAYATLAPVPRVAVGRQAIDTGSFT